jgi:phosphatidate cytidylyltransferase
VFDTFAYIIGSKLGRHKIIPRISPKKSWEGFIGGMAFTLLSVYFIRQFFDVFSINFLLLLAFVIPFTATLGDLIESFFKREAGVKDSGTLIPGHGGFLDRMDALMISIPALYILLNIFK